MIEKIEIKDEATFDPEGDTIENIKKANIFYGANGSGKTTISKVIDDEQLFPKCPVKWKNNQPLKTLVYNQEYIDREFNAEQDDIKGIYTVGEGAIDAKNKISANLLELGIKNKKLLGFKISREKAQGEIESADTALNKKCWNPNRYQKVFTECSEKTGKDSKKFKEKCLEKLENEAQLREYSELKEKYETLYNSTSEKISLIPTLASDLFQEIENNSLLQTVIIGEKDVDIAELIEKLGISDWVFKGKEFIESDQDPCPFCQQKLPVGFQEQLEKYFNTSYLEKLEGLEMLKEALQSKVNQVAAYFENLSEINNRYFNEDIFKGTKEQIYLIFESNRQTLQSKINSPSKKISLKKVKDILIVFNEKLKEVNLKIEQHNVSINSISSEKETLKKEVWKFITTELKDSLQGFNDLKKGKEKAIKSIDDETLKIKGEVKVIEVENSSLQASIVSIQPTITKINKLLSRYNYNNFYLKESEQKGSYNVLRKNGEDAKDTLSEGEKTFIYFLYFYHLIDGSNDQNETPQDRVIVFDDPISSLDSNILFIVSTLCRRIIKRAQEVGDSIKQVFILTHNIYFHKQVSYKIDSFFWVVRKMNGISKVESKLQKNPINSSYELLWKDVFDMNCDFSSLQNNMRRILENYFQFTYDNALEKIYENLEDEENQIIYRSLLSWMHAGSHEHDPMTPIDYSLNEEEIEKFRIVFKNIFSKLNQAGHYEMMKEYCLKQDAS